MKKIAFLFIIFLTTTFSAYCQDTKSDFNANELGKEAFNILKELDKSSEKDFINKLYSLQEIKAFINKKLDTVPSEIRENINQMTTEEYHKKVIDEFNDLKKVGKQYSIDWNSIEYSDFTYEKREESGLKGLRGELVFKSQNEAYIVDVEAILVEDIYEIMIVTILVKKGNH
ncbi:hypothetical protein [uncultured Kordia sp.]|uniref:hypothetical protein n=1 Tax=uncultured Kordia sp. TaxID=507699 RepID=UPI00262F8EA5|nr:hypothetical protein [uncultured Kordia sp.]